MLWLVCLFNYADRQAIYSVFPLLKTEMDLTAVQLGVVGGSFMWVYAAALPLAGIIGDRVRRTTLILGGLAFWSLITLATGWATEYWHLVLFRALEGLGEAFYFPASMSLISDYHGPDTRSRAMGLHQSSVYAGTVLGGTVAGFCADHYGWRSGFYLFGALGVVLAAVLVLFLREPLRTKSADDATPADRADVAQSIVEVFSNSTVLVQMAVFVGANFVAAIFLTWMPTFLHDKFEMSLTMAGWNATAWLQVASVLGVLCGGWLADPGGRPVSRRPADLPDRLDRRGARVDSGPDRVRVLQRPVRCQPLGRTLRRGPPGAAGHRPGADERDRLAGRRRGPGGDCRGLGTLRHERLRQRNFARLRPLRNVAAGRFGDDPAPGRQLMTGQERVTPARPHFSPSQHFTVLAAPPRSGECMTALAATGR
jgi:MFS family permease